MIKAVIFDLDNTLVDFMGLKERAIHRAADAMIDAGLQLSKSEIIDKIKTIYSIYGYEYQQVLDRLVEECCGHIDHRILANGIVAYRQEREASLVPYPHVHQTLIELIRRRYKMAVVSDAPTREAWLRLCSLKIHYVFETVVTYDDTHHTKPHPAPFLKALDKLNITPAEAMMVGDWAERDMAGAKQLGMKTVFARYGDVFHTVDSGADYEITDIADILDILNKENHNHP
jgi:putative hydrolase of the HAD superfamily